MVGSVLFFMAVVLVVSVPCGAQIPMRSVSPADRETGRIAFDSTRNFQGVNVDAYIGQTLYLKGLGPRNRGFGYERFFSRVPQSVGDTRAIYRRGAPLNRFNSQYDALAFRYFTVVEVIRSGKGVTAAYPQERVFLKLLDRRDSEILYFEYNDRHESLFPFVVQGYFEKLHAAYQGLRCLVRRTNGICGPEFGQSVVRPGDTVACAGFFVEDRTFTLLASFKRADGAELLVAPANVTGGAYLCDIAAAARIREEVGEDAFADVLRGTVKPGMSARMGELAWGKPRTVNRIVHQGGAMEQWVYSGERVLYIEDGVVSSVQEDAKADTEGR